MRDILARGDIAKAAAGVPAWIREPMPGEDIVVWDSADKIRSPYPNAASFKDLVLTIIADQPSAAEGIVFEGSMDGVTYGLFVESDEFIVGEDFEKQYRPKTPHARIRYKNGPNTLGMWNVALIGSQTAWH
jgi:hypothetical protein